MQPLQSLQLKLASLSIFHCLLTKPLFIRLQYLLEKSQGYPTIEYVKAYQSFYTYLLEENINLSELVLNHVLNSENVYIMRYMKNQPLPNIYEQRLRKELDILKEIASLSSDVFEVGMEVGEWFVSDVDLHCAYFQKINNIHKEGVGMFANYHMFVFEDNEIIPLTCPDPIQLHHFSEYQRERDVVIKNTLSLLYKEKASNLLLYGDAGTGKSSTIKAIANAYYKEGLRLIEVKKKDLIHLKQLLERISFYPLKFIIFIDDLSFHAGDENYAALKSILEGSVSAISNHICIYATSNRRHMVNETHQARAGDEIHLQDTLQEVVSLSSRFALTITFQKPNKDVYLKIVEDLAKQEEIDCPTEQLYAKAEAYALRNHGRSPRSAKQFVELLKNGI